MPIANYPFQPTHVPIGGQLGWLPWVYPKFAGGFAFSSLSDT